MSGQGRKVANADVPLERDLFLRSLLRELAGTLEDVIGVEDASGYISVVGAAIGDQINSAYKNALGVTGLSRAEVDHVLVDLKRRIEGDFYIIESTPERLVLGNRKCPFGAFVKDRPSLCMMTSNVFGSIAAENMGYANVVIDKAIALGHPECRVVVNFTSPPDENAGRDYFKTE